MSWNWVSVPPASLQSLHLSWYQEHLEISPNTTVSGQFMVELVNKKHPCAIAQKSSLQGKHLGLLGLLLFHSCAQLEAPEPHSPLSTFWAPQAPLQRASHRECWAKRWLNPQHFTRSCLLTGTWPPLSTRTNAASGESSKTFQMIQMCDCHTCPFTHCCQGSQDPCSFWLCAFHSLSLCYYGKWGKCSTPSSESLPPSQKTVMSWAALSQEMPSASQYSPQLLRWLQTTACSRNH